MELSPLSRYLNLADTYYRGLLKVSTTNRGKYNKELKTVSPKQDYTVQCKKYNVQ